MIDEKEANAYIQKILNGEIEPATDEERRALQRLERVTQEMNNAQREKEAAIQRVEEMRDLSKKFEGKREAYIEVLINIEIERRAKETEKPIPLDDFRDRDQSKITEGTNDTDDGKPGRESPKAPGESEGS